jgi:hypothetical protein
MRLVAGPVDTDYTSSQMTYDLCRLRLPRAHRTDPPHQHVHGHHHRAALPRSSTPRLTPECYDPFSSRPDKPPAPVELRRALATIDHRVTDYVINACLEAAA